MATSEQLAEIRSATGQLVTLAGKELQEFWDALYGALSPIEFRDELLKFFPDLVTTYGDTAGVIGADWYEQLRSVQRQGVSVEQFRAVIALPAPDEQSIALAKWALGPTFDEQSDSLVTLERLTASLQRLVNQPFRDSIWYAAGSDPVRTGVLRMPAGLVTCRFCVMLASRGPVYSVSASGATSAGSVVGRGSTRSGFGDAGKRLSGGIGGGVRTRGSQPIGNRYHDECDCIPVLVQSPGDLPETYSQKHFEELYAKGSGVGRDLPVE